MAKERSKEWEALAIAVTAVVGYGETTSTTDKMMMVLAELGYRVVRNDPDHYVCFTEDTWFIEHSLDCRIAGAIGTCRFNTAIRDIADDMRDSEQLGRWRITGIDSEGVPSLEQSAPAEKKKCARCGDSRRVLAPVRPSATSSWPPPTRPCPVCTVKSAGTPAKTEVGE